MRARGAAAGESLSLHRSEYSALIEWAERRRKLLSLSYVERFQPVTTGAEHAVYYDPARGVAVKATHANRFGHSADGVQKSATPLEYLRRLGWHNVLFGDEIRIEGIACDEEQMEVVTTQPWINVHRDSPHPTRAEIDAFFANLQFHKAALTENAPIYFNRRISVIIGDAHDQNVLRDENGDLVPIDLVIGRPGPALKRQIDEFVGGHQIDIWPEGLS
jgi:hypothetical protein